ncbi:hypothetical protein QWZ10_08155 [Paracoccus cavernae]|uniref:LPS export ABC transporter periplasmic protein LptC n=1 Tax=Paracoccus cavernae TaxID=1571207 RepID=A0ABT8D7I6_9RHOB|nr:hypothetical protein [Paracoccus cavernae]
MPWGSGFSGRGLAAHRRAAARSGDDDRCLQHGSRTGGQGESLRWFCRCIAAALVIAALSVWLVSDRPKILVSAEGDAVGIMTAAGRVMSKPKGGAFSASSWLENDGDAASQQGSAARSLWSGPKNQRVAILHDSGRPRRVIHLSGKSLPDISALCHDDAILVADQDIAIDGPNSALDCRIFGKRTLTHSGDFHSLRAHKPTDSTA